MSHVSRKQYVIVLPQERAGFVPPVVNQKTEEKNLSTATRMVATLSAQQVAELKKKYRDLKIFENETFRAPRPEEMKNRVPQREVFGEVRPEVNEAIAAHGATQLHAQGIKGKSSEFAPIVVTVDTGIAAHSDLQADKRGIEFWDVFDNRKEDWNDKQTHGTHVSGIMLGNGKVTGMAPEAQFIGVKVLNDQGSGTMASVLSGLEKAAAYYDQYAKDTGRPMVVNMSLGGTAGPAATDEMHKTLKRILDERPGMVIAIAAGNSGPGANTIGSPGNFQHPRAVTVAAADTRGTQTMDDDVAANFSSRGGNDVAKGQDALRNGGLMADGTNVLSTINTGEWAKYSGTSMAAPMVAGGAALLYDLAGKLYKEGRLKVKPTEINPLELLRETALDHANIAADVEGKGELSVDRAAALLVERYGKDAGGGGPKEPKEVKKTVSPNAPIADLSTVTSTIDVEEDLALASATLDLNIAHTWRGDLKVTLVAPSGKEVVVHDRKGSSTDDVTGSFDLSEALKGESAKGTWTLKVEDKARRDVGTLKDWTLTLKSAEAEPTTGLARAS